MIVRTRAFTLIELLIVVAIIAVLAAIAVPNMLQAQTRAKVTRVVADFRNLAVAVEAYRADNNEYPLYALILTPGSSVVEDPATSRGPQAFEFLSRRPGPCISTPIAYMASIPPDLFASKFVGPEPVIRDYSYKNPRQNARNFGAFPEPGWLGEGGSVFIADWGEWRFSSAGPDLTRIDDTKANIIYDPTNGVASQGDIVRSQRRPNSLPK